MAITKMHLSSQRVASQHLFRRCQRRFLSCLVDASSRNVATASKSRSAHGDLPRRRRASTALHLHSITRQEHSTTRTRFPDQSFGQNKESDDVLSRTTTAKASAAFASPLTPQPSSYMVHPDKTTTTTTDPQQLARIVAMTRDELAHATCEEKEQWLQARLSEDNAAEAIATQVTRQDFQLLLQDFAQHAKTVPGCAVRAERWLGRLERLVESLRAEKRHKEANRLSPDATCYRHVIEAWAESSGEDPKLTVTRAHRWLMKHFHSDREWERPDTASCNAFLNVVSKGRASKDHNAIREHAELAEDILQLMVERYRKFRDSRIAPDTDSFNYVMRAWTRCRRHPDVAERTMEALRHLENYEKYFDKNVRPNTKSYGLVLDGLSCRASQKVSLCRVPHPKAHNGLNPNDKANNGLDELEMMEGIIDHMHQCGGKIAPTALIYNILITAWAQFAKNHPQLGPAAAERILQQMTRYADQGHEALRPDAKSYLLVMRAWFHTKLPQRATRAAWWLDSQWHAYNFDGKARPTTDEYNMVIRMFADTKEVEQADKHFRAMGSHDRNIRRNSETYTSIIRAWLAEAEETASIYALRNALKWLKHATKLEQEDEDCGVRSAIDSFVALLTAARHCAPFSPMDSLAVAVDAFVMMKKSHHIVGPLEYTRVLQVGLLALSRPEDDAQRTKFIRQLLEHCAEAGVVSAPFIRTLAKGPVYHDGWTIRESNRMSKELFGDWPLPHSWTRNIKDMSYSPQQSDMVRVNNSPRISSHDEDPYKRESGSSRIGTRVS